MIVVAAHLLSNKLMNCPPWLAFTVIDHTDMQVPSTPMPMVVIEELISLRRGAVPLFFHDLNPRRQPPPRYPEQNSRKPTDVVQSEDIGRLRAAGPLPPMPLLICLAKQGVAVRMMRRVPRDRKIDAPRRFKRWAMVPDCCFPDCLVESGFPGRTPVPASGTILQENHRCRTA